MKTGILKQAEAIFPWTTTAYSYRQIATVTADTQIGGTTNAVMTELAFAIRGSLGVVPSGILRFVAKTNGGSSTLSIRALSDVQWPVNNQGQSSFFAYNCPGGGVYNIFMYNDTNTAYGGLDDVSIMVSSMLHCSVVFTTSSIWTTTTPSPALNYPYVHDTLYGSTVQWKGPVQTYGGLDVSVISTGTALSVSTNTNILKFAVTNSAVTSTIPIIEVSTDPSEFTRDLGTVTNAWASALILRAKTTADMVNGFGPSIQFKEQDGTANSALGYHAMVRDGADSTGKHQFFCTGAGVTSRLDIGEASITASVPIVLPGVRLQDLDTSYSGLWGTSAGIPSSTNYGFLLKNDGTNSYLQGSVGTHLRVGATSILDATATSITASVPVVRTFAQTSSSAYTATVEDIIRFVGGTTCSVTMPVSPQQYRTMTIINNNSGAVTAYQTIQPGTTVKMIYISNAWVIVYRCSNA